MNKFSIGTKHFPGTSKLIEESGELLQVLGKLIQLQGETKHWDGDLKTRLIEEIGDVLAAIEFFTTEGLSSDEQQMVYNRAIAKLARFREWHNNGDVNPTG